MAGHVHKLVAQVAKEAAGQLYDRLMGDNMIRKAWQDQNPEATEKELESRFISRNWGQCIPFARATLATMLTAPLDSRTKDDILEALVLDAQLVRGRAKPDQIMGAISGRG